MELCGVNANAKDMSAMLLAQKGKEVRFPGQSRSSLLVGLGSLLLDVIGTTIADVTRMVQSLDNLWASNCSFRE